MKRLKKRCSKLLAFGADSRLSNEMASNSDDRRHSYLSDVVMVMALVYDTATSADEFLHTSMQRSATAFIIACFDCTYFDARVLSLNDEYNNCGIQSSSELGIGPVVLEYLLTRTRCRLLGVCFLPLVGRGWLNGRCRPCQMSFILSAACVKGLRT